MVRVSLVLFALLTLSGIASAGPLHDDLLRCVVHVECQGCQGSGTLIKHKDKLLVLTAAHVVEASVGPVKEEFIGKDGKRVERENHKPRPCLIETRNGIRRKVRVVWYSDYHKDGQLDLALLSVDDPEGLHAAELLGSRKPIEEGEWCWYCGSGGGFKFSLEKAIINQFDERLMTVNGHGWFGHSGSGYFVCRDGRYYLCGVLTQWCINPHHDPKSPLQGERQIREFLDTYKP